MVANAPLRGANNIGFPRPMGATNANSDVPMRQQQQQQQQQISTTASRGASKPRKISFPVSLSYAVLPKKYVHFFTDNIVHKPRLGQICHLFSRTLLSSKIVDIYRGDRGVFSQG